MFKYFTIVLAFAIFVTSTGCVPGGPVPCFFRQEEQHLARFYDRTKDVPLTEKERECLSDYRFEIVGDKTFNRFCPDSAVGCYVRPSITDRREATIFFRRSFVNWANENNDVYEMRRIAFHELIHHVLQCTGSRNGDTDHSDPLFELHDDTRPYQSWAESGHPICYGSDDEGFITGEEYELTRFVYEVE